MEFLRFALSFILALILVIGIGLYFYDLIDQEDEAIYVVPFRPAD